jgi:hypothetical protein
VPLQVPLIVVHSLRAAWRYGEDDGMSRRSRWWALASGVALAAAGAGIAYVLAGGSWAAAGAVIGAVTGSFAPSLVDGIRARGAADEAWRGSLEKAPAQGWARLLDPRRELVGFVGRQEELASLVAWCADDRAPRLRIVTGLGGVGKTRLAVELAERMKRRGWTCDRVADGKEGEAVWTALSVIETRFSQILLSGRVCVIYGNSAAP